MSIAHLGQALAVINPFDGYNPRGNCMGCAVETALVLTSGRNPAEVQNGGGMIDGQGGRRIVEFPDDMGQREDAVWRFLNNNAVREGVYAVDAEDHAYVFVRDVNGQPYLVDSNQQLYVRLDATGDFHQTGHNRVDDPPYPYNYGDPTPDDDGSRMVFYFFGRIADRWAQEIAR